MAHTQKRSSALREGQIALLGGALYGFSHTVSGHPLDNVKAAMQLSPGSRGKSALEVARGMYARHGARAFWRGCVPPLWGSTVYRSAMMSSYEASFTYLERVDPARDSKMGAFLHAEVLGGMRPLVVCSAVCCAVVRAVFESPIEYAKVMSQTGRPWELRDVYRGVVPQTVRTTAMLVLIFVPYDICRRKTNWFNTLAGQFAVTTTVCAASYALVWPLETLKNLAQAGTPSPGATLVERVRYLGGFRGLYIGAGPGIICGGFRNGIAMMTMAKYQDLATHLGFRDL